MPNPGFRSCVIMLFVITFLAAVVTSLLDTHVVEETEGVVGLESLVHRNHKVRRAVEKVTTSSHTEESSTSGSDLSKGSTRKMVAGGDHGKGRAVRRRYWWTRSGGDDPNGGRCTHSQICSRRTNGGIVSSNTYRYRYKTKDGKIKYRIVSGGFLTRKHYVGYWYTNPSGKMIYRRKFVDDGGTDPKYPQQFFRIVYKTTSGHYYYVIRRGYGKIEPSKSGELVKPKIYYRRYRNCNREVVYRGWSEPKHSRDSVDEDVPNKDIPEAKFRETYPNIKQIDWDTWNRPKAILEPAPAQHVGPDGEVFVFDGGNAVLLEGEGGIESTITGPPAANTKPKPIYNKKGENGEEPEMVEVFQHRNSEKPDDLNGSELVGIEEVTENLNATIVRIGADQPGITTTDEKSKTAGEDEPSDDTSTAYEDEDATYDIESDDSPNKTTTTTTEEHTGKKPEDTSTAGGTLREPHKGSETITTTTVTKEVTDVGKNTNEVTKTTTTTKETEPVEEGTTEGPSKRSRQGKKTTKITKAENESPYDKGTISRETTTTIVTDEVGEPGHENKTVTTTKNVTSTDEKVDPNDPETTIITETTVIEMDENGQIKNTTTTEGGEREPDNGTTDEYNGVRETEYKENGPPKEYPDMDSAKKSKRRIVIVNNKVYYLSPKTDTYKEVEEISPDDAKKEPGTTSTTYKKTVTSETHEETQPSSGHVSPSSPEHNTHGGKPDDTNEPGTTSTTHKKTVITSETNEAVQPSDGHESPSSAEHKKPGTKPDDTKEPGATSTTHKKTVITSETHEAVQPSDGHESPSSAEHKKPGTKPDDTKEPGTTSTIHKKTVITSETNEAVQPSDGHESPSSAEHKKPGTKPDDTKEPGATSTTYKKTVITSETHEAVQPSDGPESPSSAEHKKPGTKPDDTKEPGATSTTHKKTVITSETHEAVQPSDGPESPSSAEHKKPGTKPDDTNESGATSTTHKKTVITSETDETVQPSDGHESPSSAEHKKPGTKPDDTKEPGATSTTHKKTVITSETDETVQPSDGHESPSSAEHNKHRAKPKDTKEPGTTSTTYKKTVTESETEEAVQPSQGSDSPSSPVTGTDGTKTDEDSETKSKPDGYEPTGSELQSESATHDNQTPDDDTMEETKEEYYREKKTQFKDHGQPQEYPDLDTAKKTKNRVVIVEHKVYYRTSDDAPFKEVPEEPEDAKKRTFEEPSSPPEELPQQVNDPANIDKTDGTDEEYQAEKTEQFKTDGEPKEYPNVESAKRSGNRVVIIKKIVYYKNKKTGKFTRSPESVDEAKDENLERTGDEEEYRTAKTEQFKTYGAPQEYQDTESAKKSKQRVVIINRKVYYVSPSGKFGRSMESPEEACEKDSDDENEVDYKIERRTQWRKYGPPQEFPDKETAKKSGHRIVIINKKVYYRSRRTDNFEKGSETPDEVVVEKDEVLEDGEPHEYVMEKMHQYKEFGPPKNYPDFKAARASKQRVVIVDGKVYYLNSGTDKFKRGTETSDEARKEHYLVSRRGGKWSRWKTTRVKHGEGSQEDDDSVGNEEENDDDFEAQKVKQFKSDGEPREYQNINTAKKSGHRIVIVRRIVYYKNTKTGKFVRTSHSVEDAKNPDLDSTGDEDEYRVAKAEQFKKHGAPKEYPDKESAKESKQRVVIINRRVYYVTSSGKFRRGSEGITEAQKKDGNDADEIEYRYEKRRQWIKYGPPKEFSSMESAMKSHQYVVIINNVVYYRNRKADGFVKSKESAEDAKVEKDEVIDDGGYQQYKLEKDTQYRRYGPPKEFSDFKSARASHHRVVIINKVVYYRCSRTDRFKRAEESREDAKKKSSRGNKILDWFLRRGKLGGRKGDHDRSDEKTGGHGGGGKKGRGDKKGGGFWLWNKKTKDGGHEDVDEGGKTKKILG